MSRGIAEAIADTDQSQGLAQVMAAVMEKYADRPALGERVRKAGELLPELDTITYRELWTRVRALAARWNFKYPLHAGDRIAVLGFTSIDYATIDLACMHNGVVSVPLQSTAPWSQLRPIIAETEPTVLAASIERLGTAVEAALEIPSIQRVIVFDYDPSVVEQREVFEAAERQVVVDSLVSLMDEGWVLPPAPLAADDPEALALLLYTSGSTGTPKGAMYTQRLAGTAWYGFTYGASDVPPVVVHYMPMSHLAGRYSLMTTLANGGTGYFTARSDLSTLFEDIALARPTELSWVPRIVDMLYQQYQGLLDAGVVEADAQAELRDNVLGGRVTKVFVGTAPLSAEMVAFLENALRVTVHTGLGSTEAGGILLNTVVQRPPVLDYKLVDVPALGYFTTDKPHPRGELLLKSTTTIPGYYHRPELTAEFFTEDGYYRTGDVVAELAPDRLVVVGRTKDTLKLSQGEFVSPSRLESVFVRSPLIRQIFLYGNSSRAYLLAVVVPVGGASKAAIAESVQQVAREAELNSYEIPRDFLLEHEPFSTANGLLSESHKPRRPQLAARYREALEALYDQLAAGQTEQLRALRQSGAERPVLETVGKAAQALLGVADTELKPDAHFTDLGGDSLSALAFSRLMKEIFGVAVPVGVVISPANDLTRIAHHIETASGDRPTFESVHGAEVLATDLTLDKFFDIPEPPGPRAPEVRTVLLTGATGYLGRFLCLEWLERLAPLGGKVICVVRAPDEDAAWRRLEDSFASDDELLHRYWELSGSLEVLVGDIAAERFGLDDATWTRLADTVDAVVHPAALVNHVLPYSELFGPNVVGTAEVIRLALTTRIKPVSYVSTVAVQYGAEPFDEDADIRVASPARQLDDSYANGYANSKWAGEVLLREAHERFGLPVATFRSDMILAHNRYRGQVNVPDLFTRLLFSIVVTGLAPRSFYRTSARAHYDALPVDFVAAAVTRLAVEGFRTFNVVNPHDDGISLDTFVDWLSEKQPVRRIDDYDDWVARITTAMRALPEKQRQSSLLPTLHAFARPRESFPGSAISTRRFQDAVGEIPHLSAALIHKYVEDLRQLGLL